MRKNFLPLFLLIICIMIVNNAFSQPWMKYLSESKRSNPDFFDIQEAFNKYAANKLPEDVKGYKQYKRWEWYLEARVDSTGFLPSHILWEELGRVSKDRKNSYRGASAWKNLGPVNIPLNINSGLRMGTGRIDCLAFHPSDANTFWAGAPTGGLWKTTDGGNSWLTTTDELSCIGISDIVINPLQPDIMYIASGDRDHNWNYSIGVLKSTDGGYTWKETGLKYSYIEGNKVNKLLIHPSNPDILIAGGSKGIFKTTDAGVNWTKILTSTINILDMSYKPGDPSVIYAASYNGPVSGSVQIFKSVNGGDSFTLVSTPVIEYAKINRITFGVTPAAPSLVYALCSRLSNSGLFGLYKSTDEGVTWELMLSGDSLDILGNSITGDPGVYGQAWYDLAMAVSPTDPNELFVGGIHLWKSTDGGISFELNQDGYTLAPAYVHCDHHIFKYNPLNNILYNGNDGGVYKTTDHGDNWTDLTNGMEVLQVYRIACSATDSTRTVTGAQDDGTSMMDSATWYNIYGGDGMDCIIDYTDKNIVYVSSQNGKILISYDGAHTLKKISPDKDGAWVTPFIISPSNPKTLYIGYLKLYKSMDRGDTWVPISPAQGALIESLAVSPSDSNYIYMASTTKLIATTDEGKQWYTATPPFGYGKITDIIVSSFDPKKVWVTVGNFSSGLKVFKSTDAGKTWKNISLNLPNLPATCALFENTLLNGVYVGTDIGVFYINDSLTSWVDFSNGLPNVIVNDLDFCRSNNKVRAGTYGRGLWETPTYIKPEPPKAFFSDLHVYGCSGEVKFTNLSKGFIDSVYWDFGDGTYSSGIHPVHFYQNSGVYSVKMIVKNIFGTDTAKKELDIKTILDKPVLTSKDSACTPGSLTLTATASDSIYWYNLASMGNIIFIGDTFITPVLSSSTLYYIANAKDSACTSNRVEVKARVIPKAYANIGFNLLGNGAYTFRNISTNFNTCLWNFGDSTTSTDTAEYLNHQYAKSGLYTVKLYVYNDFCQFTDSTQLKLNVTVQGISDYSAGNLHIYPNPAHDKLFIEYDNPVVQKSDLKIYDLTGKIIHSETVNTGDGKIRFTIDTGHFKPGIYNLRFVTDKKVIYQKIAIE